MVNDVLRRLILYYVYHLSAEPIPQRQDSEHPNTDIKERSTSDILSVINKSVAPYSGSVEEEDCVIKGDGSGQSAELEGGSGLVSQGDQLTLLGESSYNIPHHANLTHSKGSIRNGRSFGVPKRQVERGKSGWNSPYSTGGPPSLGRGLPGEENQAPADVRCDSAIF